MAGKLSDIGVVVTCNAPVNIAVIKYWGKRDEKLLLPVNSSLSGTLSIDQLHTKTSVAAHPSFTADRIWLNGVEEDINNQRLQNCLKEIRRRASDKDASNPLLGYKVHICSVNNFPTAAGLASSAAGYACLVFTLAQLFGVSDTELTAIARVGSGSACRSLHGGFVRWSMGVNPDGSDSIASQVVPESHWPEMQILILVVNANKKAVSSTSGMETSVQTSQLLKHRCENIVEGRMREMERAIQARDFPSFARLTIQDSNQFHAVCLDTYPPIFYMNDVSRMIVQLLTKLNAHPNGIKAAYTFDAGPNAVIYALAENVPEILALVAKFFPSSEPDFFRGLTTVLPSIRDDALPSGVSVPEMPDAIKYVIHTKLGCGPQVLPADACLIRDDGLPKSTA